MSGTGFPLYLGANDKDMNAKGRKTASRQLCLGDLILAVSSSANSQEETVAAIADLLASGKVRLMNNGRQVRARVR